MGFEWDLNGIFLGFSCDFHGGLSGTFMAFNIFNGMFMGFSWGFIGI